jgi:hypothetical protein
VSAPLNRRRAAWAEYAVTAFSSQTGADGGIAALHDLIADLGHYAIRQRLDFVRVVARALSTWADECKHAEGIGPGPQVTIAIAGRPPAYAWRQREIVPDPESSKKVSTPRSASGRLTVRAHSRKSTTRRDRS